MENSRDELSHILRDLLDSPTSLFAGGEVARVIVIDNLHIFEFPLLRKGDATSCESEPRQTPGDGLLGLFPPPSFGLNSDVDLALNPQPWRHWAAGRWQPIPMTITPEHKREVLLHFLRSELHLDIADSWGRAKYPQDPRRSAIKRLRQIRRELRGQPEATQDAIRLASLIELIDQLSLDQSQTFRHSMQLLRERHGLIVQMRRRDVNRSPFTDEVMNAKWLTYRQKCRALRNRPWFCKQKRQQQSNVPLVLIGALIEL